VRTKREDNNILVEISDDGPSIPQDIQSRIFEQFFTTKIVGKGTGLGLSISYCIVVKMHRAINSQLTINNTFSYSEQPMKTHMSVNISLNKCISFMYQI